MYQPTETELKEMKFTYDKYVKWWEKLLFGINITYKEGVWKMYSESGSELFNPESKEDIETLIRLLK